MIQKDIVVPVILCGGSGTRLWPMSREQMPKQFLSLIGEETLLQATALRAMLVGKTHGNHVVTVTLEAMRDGVAEQYDAVNPALAEHILCEPMPRNTAAAVAFAARYVAEIFGPGALMWILAADHHMGDVERLGEALEHAIKGAQDGRLVTFGIAPSRPETGYGYIKTGAPLDGRSDLLAVDRFVEKPARDVAEEFLKSGEYLWNSGMFLFRADSILESYRRHAPKTLEIVESATQDNPKAQSIAPEIYGTIPEEPFDKAIMEKSDRVAVVPCDPQWSDIGSWESLWEIAAQDSRGNVLHGRVYTEQSEGCYIRGEKRLIACAGLKNVVIVETADAILVADKSNGDALKKLVTRLRSERAPEAFDRPGVRTAAE